MRGTEGIAVRLARTLALLLSIALLLVVAPLASAKPKDNPDGAVDPGSGVLDFPGDKYNVLPPGQDGTLFGQPNSTDQIPLYDGLTPKFDQITRADLDTFFKPAIFGLAAGEQPRRVETTPLRPGLRIERDGFGVPHVSADSRADVMFGAGWVSVEDKGFLMELLRGPGRIGALDVPGVDAFSVAASFRQFTPTQQTEDFLASQLDLLRAQGPKGEQVIEDVRAYVAGINGYLASINSGVRQWTDNDVLSVGALVAATLGRGGGDETRRSQLLSALQQRLGDDRGSAVWDDLREAMDPETPVTIDRSFRYGGPSKHQKGNVVIDDGSFEAVSSAAVATGGAPRPPRQISNALLVGANRSQSGHPLFVAGPQTGYFHPEVLTELDLHGGGIDVRGVTFPGSGPWVQMGRGRDFVWSATSAGSDTADHFVEELCGSDTSYRFRGRCVEMTNFDAGLLGAGAGQPPQQLAFRETVHGPVIGYATSEGRRVAISQKRSTRGREVVNAVTFADLNANVPDSAESFIDLMSQFEFTFNWFYADHEDIAMFSSGRLPIRHKHVDTGLPTLGTGKYEWRGFLSPKKHPQAVNPDSGAFVNWNNKPAEGFTASDRTWSYGSVQRVQLLEDAVARREQHTLESLVGAMNRAATQDLRSTRVVPTLVAVLEGSAAPSERAARMLELLEDWNANGSSRLDLGFDLKIDHPGAAILDAAWPRIADAVMGPVLGPQLDDLGRLMTPHEAPRPAGSAFQEGWYGYVDKDLRTIAGLPVEGEFNTRFCGLGDLETCRQSLWAAIEAAGAELAAAQGPDPSAWRQSSVPERIRFEPGFLRTTMRWTNRPTFQQVFSFTDHR